MVANIRRFIEMLELIDFHRTTFQYELKQYMKKRFNDYFTQHQGIRKALQSYLDEQSIENLDNKGCLMWEIYDQVEKAGDPRKVLAVIQAYNEGLIATSDNLDQPINQLDFETLASKKQEILETVK